MIIAPVLDTDRVQLAPGHGQSREGPLSTQSTDALTIIVRADNTIWVDHRPISLADLENGCREKKRAIRARSRN